MNWEDIAIRMLLGLAGWVILSSVFICAPIWCLVGPNAGQTAFMACIVIPSGLLVLSILIVGAVTMLKAAIRGEG